MRIVGFRYRSTQPTRLYPTVITAAGREYLDRRFIMSDEIKNKVLNKLYNYNLSNPGSYVKVPDLADMCNIEIRNLEPEILYLSEAEPPFIKLLGKTLSGIRNCKVCIAPSGIEYVRGESGGTSVKNVSLGSTQNNDEQTVEKYCKVFISHDSDEKALAEPLANWLDNKLIDANTFCSSRPGDIAAQQWRAKVIKDAKEYDVLIILMSPKSISNPWIQFEAGLARSNIKCKIVPAIYGGLDKMDVPSTINDFQILDMSSVAEFNATFRKIFSDQIDKDTDLTYSNFLDSCERPVDRIIRYGVIANWLDGDIITHKETPFEFTQDNNIRFYDIVNAKGRISSVRMKILPITHGSSIQWKCGFKFLKTTAPPQEKFSFHSGCHHGVKTFSYYPDHLPERGTPIDIPADLSHDKSHAIQLWFGPDFSQIQCFGIDASRRYYLVTNDGVNPIWRPDTDIDKLQVYAWNDNQGPFRVRVEELEIDYLKT